MSMEGYIPEHLSEAALRKLLLEALEEVPDWSSPESFHALFDHLERGLSSDDVIHGIESEWTLRGRLDSTPTLAMEVLSGC